MLAFDPETIKVDRSVLNEMRRLRGLPQIDDAVGTTTTAADHLRSSVERRRPFDPVAANAPNQLKKSINALLKTSSHDDHDADRMQKEILDLVCKYTVTKLESEGTVLDKINSIPPMQRAALTPEQKELMENRQMLFEDTLALIQEHHQPSGRIQLHQYMIDVAKELVLHPLLTKNVHVIKTKLDGSSLYYAVSQAVFGDETYMRILRLATLYTLLKDRIRYMAYISSSKVQNVVSAEADEIFQQLLLCAKNVMQMHNYPNDILVDALSTAIGRPIYIYSSCVDPQTKQVKQRHITDINVLQKLNNKQNGEPGYFYSYGFNMKPNAQPICLFYEGAHFQPILPVDDDDQHQRILLKPIHHGLDESINPIIKAPEFGTPKRARMQPAAAARLTPLGTAAAAAAASPRSLSRPLPPPTDRSYRRQSHAEHLRTQKEEEEVTLSRVPSSQGPPPSQGTRTAAVPSRTAQAHASAAARRTDEPDLGLYPPPPPQQTATTPPQSLRRAQRTSKLIRAKPPPPATIPGGIDETHSSDDDTPAWSHNAYATLLSNTSVLHNLTVQDVKKLIADLIRPRGPDGESLQLWENYYEVPEKIVNENYEKCKQFLQIAQDLPTAIFRGNGEQQQHVKEEDVYSDARTQLHPVILQELVAIKTKGYGNW